MIGGKPNESSATFLTVRTEAQNECRRRALMAALLPIYNAGEQKSDSRSAAKTMGCVAATIAGTKRSGTSANDLTPWFRAGSSLSYDRSTATRGLCSPGDRKSTRLNSSHLGISY